MVALLLSAVALGLLAAASRRPADHLRLSRAARRTARLTAAALLLAAIITASAGGDGGRWLVEWTLALGLLVMAVTLAATQLLSQR